MNSLDKQLQPGSLGRLVSGSLLWVVFGILAVVNPTEKWLYAGVSLTALIGFTNELRVYRAKKENVPHLLNNRR